MEKVYKLKEVESLIGVSRRTLYNYLKSGQLKGVKLSGSRGDWRIREEDLQAFIDQNKA